MRAVILVFLGILIWSSVGTTTSEARPWRPDPTSLALDYLTIQDRRGPREVVVVFWAAPQLIPENSGGDDARGMLAKRLIIGIVHGDVNELGQFTFREVAPPAISTGNSDIRTHIDVSQLEPRAIGAITTIQAMMKNGLGRMGQGIHWFVYDGTGIDSCGPGRLIVPYAGENYSYDLPIPGCN